MKARDRRASHLTLVFEWGKSIGLVQPPKFMSRILQKFYLNTTRPTAHFMTVPGYVDSDDLVWRRRWLIPPEPRLSLLTLVNALLWFVIPQPRNRNYSLFSHCLRPPAMQGATLISNSRRTTSSPGALRWVGRVLVDEAKRPKPESREGSAYFAIPTLFGS